MAHQIHPAADENGASGFQSESSDDCHSFDSESSTSLKVDGRSSGEGRDTVDLLPVRSSFMRSCYEGILRFVPQQLQRISVANGNSPRLNHMPVKKDCEEYKMTHETIGKAVIFSFSKWNKRTLRYRMKPLPHYFFTEKSPKPNALDKPSRARLQRDEEQLIEVLKHTGFLVERYHNLKSDSFHEKLQSLRSEDHWQSDCLLIIIITHGGNNTLFLSDRTQFPVHCLWTEYFEAHKCPSLAAKPKIFLVQALSDSFDDDVDETNGNDDFADTSRRRESLDDKDCGNFSYSIPNAADIIVAFTYPTATSVEYGSSLILNFAQVLEQYAFEYDINQIFTLVSNAMKHNDAQHLVILSTLIRQLKFKQKQIHMQETDNLIDQSTRETPQINRDTHYNVDTSRRGKAIVFNFHKFHKVHGAVAQKNRDGSKKDLEDLRKLFVGMNFDFVPHSDLTNYRFQAELRKIRNEDHSEAECLVVVVMTHGEKNRLIMADHAQFPIHFVWKYFEDHACPSLKGKPKIFIIQACRGNEFDNGTCVSYVGEDSSSSANNYIDSTSLSCIKPMSPDIFVAYSTPFGKLSLRNELEGSWFIQEVVKVLSNHHSSMDIHGLFTTVARNVATNYTSSSSTDTAMANKKQVPCITSTLTKTYIFSDRTSNVENIDQQ